MNSLCQTCRKLLYRTDPCRSDGVECGRTDGGAKNLVGNRGFRKVLADTTQKSTAARKDVLGTEGKGPVSGSPDRTLAELEVAPRAGDQAEPGAGAAAPPVDTPKPKHKDRHKPGYQAEKQRQYRANKKAKEAAK